MRRTVALTVVLLLLVGTQTLAIAKANPIWANPSPYPPITDPPQIIITSPSLQEYGSPVPINITIIQPNSWVSKFNLSLPEGYVDNSDNVVVGQNTVRSITCIIDGTSFILWKGTSFGSGITYFGSEVTYYLPRETTFSASLSASKGQHTLQVNVSAISEYVAEGLPLPFAVKTYDILASQSINFSVSSDSNSNFSLAIHSEKSSYEVWQLPTPTVPEFSWLAVLPLFVSLLFIIVKYKHKSTSNSVFNENWRKRNE
jgi:hypothetical protein